MDQERIAALARAIGHPLRVGVLERLCEGPALVGDIVDGLEVKPTALSRHLTVLRDAGLVECEVEWRCRRYRVLDGDVVQQALAALDRVLAKVGSEGDQR